MKKRVAFYMTTVLELGGGLEKYLIETAELLNKTDKISIDLITLDDTFTLKIKDLLTFYYFKKYSTESLFRETSENILKKLLHTTYIKCHSILELRNTLKKYDCIYSKNELLEGFIFKFLIGYNNIPPIIFGVHTPHFYPITKSIQSKLHNFLYSSFIYNFLCSGVKVFHVANEQSYKLLSNQFGKEKVVKIFNPFSIDNFINEKGDKNLEITFDDKKFNIMWIARATEQKGVDDLVYLVDNINSRDLKSKVRWYIAGTGDMQSDLNDLSDKWDNVHYLGHISNILIPKLLKRANLFISTSKWEVMPYNVIEAQAMDVPVLAYAIPGPVDIIRSEETGIIVENFKEMESKLIDIINGKYIFNHISKNIREKFDPSLISIKLIKLFESVK